MMTTKRQELTPYVAVAFVVTARHKFVDILAQAALESGPGYGALAAASAGLFNWQLQLQTLPVSLCLPACLPASLSPPLFTCLPGLT